MRNRHVLPLLFSLGLVSVSCSSLESPPLESGGNGTAVTVCTPRPDDGVVTFGPIFAVNASERDVTIDAVELVDASGLELFDVRAVSVGRGGTAGPGAAQGWAASASLPTGLPSGSTTMDVDVSAEVVVESPRAVGTTIKPASKDPAQVQFVLGVRTATGGESSGLRVTYTDDRGQGYVWRAETNLIVGTPAC